MEISGKVAHQGERTSPQYLAYHGAGILVWKDDRTYIRLERAGLINADGQFVHYLNFELRRDGQVASGGGINVPDKPTFLRLARRGNKFNAAYGPDGKQWTELEPLEVDLPLEVKVGVAAVNTSTEAFDAQFDKFAVVRTKAAGKVKP